MKPTAIPHFFSRLMLGACVVAASAFFQACSDDDPTDPTDPDQSEQPGNDDDDSNAEINSALYILNEGNYGYGNATLSLFYPKDNSIQNGIFYKANGFFLGDCAQSMTIEPESQRGWIVVNNSNVVYAIDLNSNNELGRIDKGLISPRFIHFVSSSKAYITQLYDNRIAVIDPSTYSITSYITIPGMDTSTGSTEMMEQVGQYVYVNCWSYNNSVVKIDTQTDAVVASIEVGIQPKSMVKDCDNNLWVLTDGGYYGSPYGYEQPRLVKISTETFTIEQSLTMPLGSYTPSLAINGAGNQLYWVCNDIYTMPITSTELPENPIINSNGTYYYGLTVSPYDENIYIADAVDYSSNGQLLRYTPAGQKIASVETGVCPHGFCWR